MIAAMFQRICRVFSPHPSEGQLLALHDGEAPQTEIANIQAHLKKCSRCRTRLAAIEGDMRHLANAFSSADGLSTNAKQTLEDGIRRSIQSWRIENLQAVSPKETDAPSESAGQKQMADTIGVYLGQRAADALMHKESPSSLSGRETMENAGSVLRALLGNRGTLALESKLGRILARHPQSNGVSGKS